MAANGGHANSYSESRVVCPLHSTIVSQVNDHEARVRVIEHCDPERIAEHDGRLKGLERVVDQLHFRISMWAAIGMILGGIGIQAFTRYVLGW